MYDAAPAVELLERAIGYTRGALADVRPVLLCRPTPCSRWRLGVLLEHMADSLDALTEASSGFLPLTPVPATSSARKDPVETLQVKACSLLGAWTSPAARTVLIGGRHLDARLLLGAGALEIAVHGWDVAQATGAELALPAELAAELFPVARSVVGDRGTSFAPIVPWTEDASASDRLLAFTGRAPLLHHRTHT